MVGAEGHEVTTAATSKSDNALDLVPACVSPPLVLLVLVVRRRRLEPHKAMFAFSELLRCPLAGSCQQVSEPDLLWVQASPLEGFSDVGVVAEDQHPAGLGKMEGLCREVAVFLLGGPG